MANLIARNSTGLTTAATWGVAEAGASATQTTRSANTNTTTSYVYSSAFTVTNLNVIEGLLLRCKRLNSTGTVTVTLSEDNGVTATREVTVNASDLPLTDDSWVFFKFGSTLTGDGGADYKVGIKGSSAANATFYRDGTAGNWTRILRTSTTQVPVAADAFYIAGEWTAAATVTAITVTLDETATTDYGTMDIGHQGTATAGTTAATNYNLKLSGDLNVWAGGTLSLGTVGTPVPSGSTFKLNFDCGSNVQYGLNVNNQGTFIAQGASKTVRALLAANAAGGATTITTDVSTGWLNGDEIAIASTSQTGSECEKKTMSGAATGTSVPIAALASAHSGTSPTQAELANLTRNVQIFGASASLQAYVYFAAISATDVDYTEFYWLGSNTANKRGIDIAVTTGSVDLQYSSFHDFIVVNSEGAYVSVLGAAGTVNLNHNVMVFIAARHIQILTTANTTWSVNDTLMIRNTDNTNMVLLTDIGGTFTNNTVVGCVSNGIEMTEAGATLGTFSGLTVHSGGGINIGGAPVGTVTLTASTVWRCIARGFYYNPGASQKATLVFDGFTAFGNATNNLQVQSEVTAVIINNAVVSGDSTFASQAGLYLSSSGPVTINNSQFGVASGIKAAHTTSDIYLENTGYMYVNGSNSTFASTAPFTASNTNPGSVIGINKFGQVSGDNRTYILAATSNAFNVMRSDSAIYNTASPSERLTPATAAIKMLSGSKAKTVASGATATFSVYVRKSISTDAGGANYNGAEPRLRVRTNAALGIGDGVTDVTLDTVSVGLGAWELLTGTTGAVSEDGVLVAYADCDGTAGWINVDDWS